MDEFESIASSEIQPRSEVFDADGERLGEVSEVGATTFLVETSLGTALEISFTDVESADGGRVELSVSGEELMADRETAS